MEVQKEPAIREFPRESPPERVTHALECDDDTVAGRHFGSVKPWIGNNVAPSDFVPSAEMALPPRAVLVIDHVYGYRIRQSRNNIFWIDEPTVFMYPAAAIVSVYDVAKRQQRQFLGHEDDVLCLAFHKESRLAASGGLGARNTAPIFIWSVDTMKVKAHLHGVLCNGVSNVSFSLDGTRVFGVALDTQNTVAIYDIATGACLANAVGDMNRIAGVINDTSLNASRGSTMESRKRWVTIGVSHIKFWRASKGGTVLEAKKAIGGDIATQTMVGAACTKNLVVIGNVAGALYLFSEGILVHTVPQAHSSYTCGMKYIDDGPNSVLLTGGRDGALKRWTVDETAYRLTLDTEIDMNRHCPLSAIPPEGDGHGNVGTGRKNTPRAIDASSGTGHLLVGTELGEIFIVNASGTSVTPVIKSHFDTQPGSTDELFEVVPHPTEPLFASVGDNAVIGLWSAELRTAVVMRYVAYPARTCAFSPDGGMIAVGHRNGCFSVWDAVTLAPHIQFTRKRIAECSRLRFSPNGLYLAISMGLAKIIDLFDAKREFIHLREFNIDCGIGRSLDWNANSSIIRVTTHSYEQLWFDIQGGCRANLTPELADEKWDTMTGIVGWGVQGIWEAANDGSDVNSVCVNRQRDLVAVGFDDCKVRLFRFPCLVRQAIRGTAVQFPQGREFAGHGSHVTSVAFSHDGKYLFTAGGCDLTIIQWRVVRKSDRDGERTPTQQELSASHRSGDGAPVGDDAPTAATSAAPEETFLQRIERGRILELGKTTSAATMRATRSASAQARVENVPFVRQRSETLNAKTASFRHVASRFLQTTASMAEKARVGRAMAEHAKAQEQTKKRFQI